MAKPKRDEKADAKDAEYEFKLPNFDERAFVRREVQSAKASFWTVGLGVAAGLLATAVWAFSPKWWYAWAPLLLALATLRPLLLRMGFEGDIVAPKALVGSYFMLFFTGLSIWVLAVNFVPAR